MAKAKRASRESLVPGLRTALRMVDGWERRWPKGSAMANAIACAAIDIETKIHRELALEAKRKGRR